MALAREMSAKYDIDYRAAAYDDRGNLVEHGRKLTRQKVDARLLFRNRPDVGRRLAAILEPYRASRLMCSCYRGMALRGFGAQPPSGAPGSRRPRRAGRYR